MSLARIALALVGAWLLSKAWRLHVNHQAAAKSGLPYLIWPVDPENIFFIVLQIPVKLLFRILLPTSWYERATIGIMGWEFDDKNRLHERVGPAFMLVTAGTNQLWCADPAMASAILARRKDFVQLPLASKIMRFLGENILTSDGESWARQRRLVAPNLNERISAKVWAESLAQARQMTAFLLRKKPAADTVSCLRAVAINVLGRVGYDQPRPFRPMELPRSPGAPMTYVEAVSLCTELLVLAALLPGWLLRLPFMPRAVRTVGAAVGRLPGLTEAMLEEERRVAAGTDAARDNVMSMLVRLSDQGKADDRSGKEGGGGGATGGQFLTEDEIAGNLFIFTGAGFDTTATTLTYAVALLAVYPEWQAWIQEEIDAVFGAAAGGVDGTPDYTTCFPKLNRCLALMCETLRLFPPIIHLSRSIAHAQTLTAAGRTYGIPGPCTVYINSVGLHHDRGSWGADADAFRPSRWLVALGAADDGGPDQLVAPARGTFLAWSAGPRVCPGQKMSQVEFVTVVATLFGRLCVEPVGKEGQGRGLREAREYLKELMQDSSMRLTLQMNRQEEFRVRWLAR